MQSNIPCCVTKFVLQAESMWNLWDTTACGLLGTASVNFLITYSDWILQHTTALIYMYRKNLSRPNPLALKNLISLDMCLVYTNSNYKDIDQMAQ